MAEVCRAFRNNGKCRYGDDCKFEHSEGEAIQAPPRGQCHTFGETGACEYGERCRFLHGEGDTRFEEREAKREAERKARAERGDEAPRARKPRNRKPRPLEPREKLDEDCQNYLEGRCYYGDNCRRRHVGDVELKPVEKIDEVCNNFLAGRCRFGDMCRRQHPADQAPAAAAQ